ncbi:MAG: hypothetical protein Q7V20_21245 [Aquabacterium sp.]|uniref:hypothetical protein n=1 Tax=Aquabacterium sp. TaxID=1872578 RepID=UPI002717B53E|nr:hypothetical protein [Aquabacterium sp.]MDO9005978.1 hypothetical protein [Aquabacterium sp.]
MHLSRFSGTAASSTSIARVLVLAAALLCAQWVGMLHRIDHAGGQAHLQQAHGQSDSSPASPSSLSHSCVVFDGAYLADWLPTALVGFCAEHRAHVLPSAIGFASWQGLFFGHFQPRAPPAA